MRTLWRVLIVIGLVVVLLVGAVGLFAWHTVRASFPQVSGEVTTPGLTAPVTVVRDSLGIPQIYADGLEDLFFAQGYVHAQDRFWEMDVRRHITSGRLSEMFGKSQVTTDSFLRTLGWRRIAEQELPLLSQRSRVILDSYSKGVNAYLATHADDRISLEYAVLGLQNLPMARVAIGTPSTPCWTAMLAFGEAIPAPPVIRDRGIIAWAACNNSKPGRHGVHCWTIQASAGWSRRHLEAERDFVTASLREAFAEIVGLPGLATIAETSHRWRFALSGSAGSEAIWDPATQLGVCGDWLIGAGVENAWLSGRRLAELILTGVEQHHPQMRIGTAARLSR